MEDAGIDPPSVTDVVLTHMHMDHCSGLLADDAPDALKARLRHDTSKTRLRHDTSKTRLRHDGER